MLEARNVNLLEFNLCGVDWEAYFRRGRCKLGKQKDRQASTDMQTHTQTDRLRETDGTRHGKVEQDKTNKTDETYTAQSGRQG